MRVPVLNAPSLFALTWAKVRNDLWNAACACVLLVLALLCMATPLAAAPATYTGESPVNSQSEAERSGAIKNALAKVVIERSGDAGILARDEVAKAVAKAEQYVLQYRYRRDAVVDPASNAAGMQLILVAEFDRAAVDRMLDGLGLGSGQTSTPVSAAAVDHRIWISGIHSAEDYARGMGYLTRQAMVREAWPLEARGDGILVKVAVAGDFSRWLVRLGEEAVLQVNSANPPIDGIDATLVLQP
ncbi:MAG: DUF2066 domain-containing protein [Gammaproteobacteria bacterium]|nr:MAG: DUF2066 domain-containing protein [Gammaproteobacteria bacterium]